MRSKALFHGKKKIFFVAILPLVWQFQAAESLGPSFTFASLRPSLFGIPLWTTAASAAESTSNSSISLRPLGSTLENSNETDPSQHPNDAATASVVPKVILLDVDNTLYREDELVNAGYRGIEAQIVKRIHNFCASRCGLTPEQANNLHHKYGATIEGLRQTAWTNLSAREQEDRHSDFYHSVYQDLDLSGLWGLPKPLMCGSTGYSHTSSGFSKVQRLRNVIQACHNNPLSDVRFAIASNSPRYHVDRILHALGLGHLDMEILTPDTVLACEDIGQDMNNNSTPANSLCRYPTKTQPTVFFQSLLARYPQPGAICLIDDSQTVLESIQLHTPSIRGIHVSKKRPLMEAVGLALGWLDPDHVAVDDARYLQSKNVVDMASIHKDTWRSFMQQLTSLIKTKPPHQLRADPLVVVDLGAGLFSMLRLLLGQHNRPDLASHNLQNTVLADSDTQARVDQIVYYAYESNEKLASASIANLRSMGFEQDVNNNQVVSKGDSGQELKELVFFRQESNGIPYTEVRLRLWDYRIRVSEDTSASPPKFPDAIVGCCFADLMEPQELVQSILEQFLSTSGSKHGNTLKKSQSLLYFPITFCGTTQFMPPLLSPPKHNPPRATWPQPSDAAAFRLYAKELHEQHGHNLDPLQLQYALQHFGGELLAQGPSDWEISPRNHSYLWHTMLYFLGTTAAPAIHAAGLDARAWLERARQEKPLIRATNRDLLFSIPFLGTTAVPAAEAFSNDKENHVYEEIQFTAPRTVRAVTRPKRTLKANEVRIDTICSLVSSGTELKIFSGQFDETALDVNIQDMQDKAMAYPLAYGYCLVGRVVECGGDKTPALMGKLVFAFAPHASQATVDREALQIVPDGVDPLDAIFMPSVETALSIVHDAQLKVGEKVAVIGQGLIGLLVTAILSRIISSKDVGTSPTLSSVTAIDPFAKKLAAACALGASQALMPAQTEAAGPFDVTIEVSGNSKALQSAVDNTRDFGRIVVASWYGSTPVALKLGLENFHRSHKTIVASQVSELPPHMRGTWTKARRFQVSWDLVRSIRPSQFLLSKLTPLSTAQSVYEALEKGKEEIAVAFEYNKQSKS